MLADKLRAATAKSPSGQNVFGNNNTFTVPAGVTSICVLCIGGGGSGAARNTYFSEYIGGGGGGGGGVAYKNNLSVTPGETLDVVVGARGNNNVSPGGEYAGDSWVARGATKLVHATGGQNGYAWVQATSQQPTGGAGGYKAIGDGGGSGGNGGSGVSSNDATTGWGGGGGGAGGYSGTGGNGGTPSGRTRVNGGAGSGGGAGGGSSNSGATNGIYPGSGGGVTWVGQGSNGAGGGNWTFVDYLNNTVTSYGGQGGSGGNDAGNSGVSNTTNAGDYGGGGAGGAYVDAPNNITSIGRAGQSGVVAIIWGTGRSYPSNY